MCDGARRADGKWKEMEGSHEEEESDEFGACKIDDERGYPNRRFPVAYE